MIAFLRGKLAHALPTVVTIDVAGVGYEVLIPLSTFDRLPGIGGEAFVWTSLVVREDAHTLYGFATDEERELFRTLVQAVSGVGPKMALNILSQMTPTMFEVAVREEDTRALSQISGIGKKTAERILVEMRDKVKSAPVRVASDSGVAGAGELANTPKDEAIRALIALQFKPSEAAESVRKASAKLGDDASTEALVRECLRK